MKFRNLPASIGKGNQMIVTNKQQRGDRTVRLPLKEIDYQRFVKDRVFAKETIDHLYHDFPELFPASFDKGYVFNGLTPASI